MTIIRTGLTVYFATIFLAATLRAEQSNPSASDPSRAPDWAPRQTAGSVSNNGVEWSSRTMEVTAATGQKAVVVTYTLRNSSARPVHIERVMANCDCVLAEAMREVVPPGETGDIRVEFTLGARSGRQEKTITVTTDAASETTLSLIVNIPEMVSITPKFVFWRIGEEAREKAMEITLADPVQFKSGEVSCPEPGILVRLVAGEAPGRYRVLARPVDTTRLLQVPIRLVITMGGQPRVFVLQAAVK